MLVGLLGMGRRCYECVILCFTCRLVLLAHRRDSFFDVVKVVALKVIHVAQGRGACSAACPFGQKLLVGFHGIMVDANNVLLRLSVAKTFF